mmetsp:Transcript_5165/g.9725  ORF Transcript_5165/g.9725 Transcript_5165/m.9725 type:complete len:81 (+) Transcript_5165:1174-1416(+)
MVQLNHIRFLRSGSRALEALLQKGTPRLQSVRQEHILRPWDGQLRLAGSEDQYPRQRAQEERTLPPWGGLLRQAGYGDPR